MKREESLALADRVEQAEGADEWLDACILAAIGELPEWARVVHAGRKLIATQREYGIPVVSIGKHGPSVDVPRYTASLDAAMTLVPEGCAMVLHGPWGGRWKAGCDKQISGAWGEDRAAATPALALTAASLRALAQEATI